jgi:hypothetical protein
MEALVASVVLVIPLLALGGVASGVLKKSRTPDDLGRAAWFAAERMNYFRSQLGQQALGGSDGSVSGFVAAGGTYYPPPVDSRLMDRNTIAAYHNLESNRRPALLVREYLYDTPQLRQAVIGGNVSGDMAARRAWVPNRRFAVNELPLTPAVVTDGTGTRRAVTRVVPNPTEDAAAPDFTRQPDDTVAIPAPRANDHLRGRSFSMAEPNLRFVREVWFQTMHPLFPPGSAGGVPAFAPAFVPSAPYGVVLTVRVFLRNPRVRTYSPIAAGTSGPGFDPRRPLAELVGVVGFQ